MRLITCLLVAAVMSACSTTKSAPKNPIDDENRQKVSTLEQPETDTDGEETDPTPNGCLTGRLLCDPISPDLPVPQRKFRLKFSGIWTDVYDSNLSPQQHAFCVADANRKEFKSYDDWVVLINEVPTYYDRKKPVHLKGKVIGVVETKCSIIEAIFPDKILLENYDEGTALYVTGDVKDDTLHVEKFVRVN